MFLLLTWKVTAIASNGKPLDLALLLTGALIAFSGRVVDRNSWLLRLGWTCPHRRYCV